jgi:hypothetical protein
MWKDKRSLAANRNPFPIPSPALFLHQALFGRRVFAGIVEYYPGPSPNFKFSPEGHLVLEFWAETIPAHPRKTPSLTIFLLRLNPRPTPRVLSPSPSKPYPSPTNTKRADGGDWNGGDKPKLALPTISDKIHTNFTQEYRE